VKAIVAAILSVVRAMIGALLLASMVLICANAFGRYVLLKPIIWAEEVLGYALVWMVYFGAVLVTWDQNHLKMDLLTKGLTGFWRRFVDAAAAATFIAAGLLVIYQSISSIAGLTHTSLVAGLPMHVLHAAIPVSFALMIICVVARVFSKPAGTGPATENSREEQRS
jgi:TRAP-type C4-dicarboxylate transport system permease small subunit